VAARAGAEGLNPARSVHEAAQVLVDRFNVVAHNSVVDPLTTTYSVVPMTAQAGWSMVKPPGLLTQEPEKAPEVAENVF